MANRLILALLALLTGLAAQAGPAHARADTAQSAQVCAVAAVFGEAAITAKAAWLAHEVASKSARSVDGTAPIATAPSALTPCVRIGIDRARE